MDYNDHSNLIIKLTRNYMVKKETPTREEQKLHTKLKQQELHQKLLGISGVAEL